MGAEAQASRQQTQTCSREGSHADSDLRVIPEITRTFESFLSLSLHDGTMVRNPTSGQNKKHPLSKLWSALRSERVTQKNGVHHQQENSKGIQGWLLWATTSYHHHQLLALAHYD